MGKTIEIRYGDLIKVARVLHKITAVKIAARVGISTSALSYIENGIRSATTDERAKIEAALPMLGALAPLLSLGTTPSSIARRRSS